MSDDPQLSLRAPCFEPSASSPLPAVVAAIAQGRPHQALVHLWCPGCRWRQSLRLPRARPRRIETLLPRVPVRHWVFSLGASAQPRLSLARVRTRVARACVGAVFAWLRRAAARTGLPSPVRCGAVSAVHRVGAALEANVHVHALVLDGVYYTGDLDDTPVFHPLSPPRRRDLRRLLAELRRTLDAILLRVPPEPSPPSKARVVQRVATGPVVVPSSPPSSHREALVERLGELDVCAGPAVAGDDHVVRARLCRYVGRLPFDPAALSMGDEGRLRYRLHHPFGDGTTHVELSPRALAERLEHLVAGDWRPPVAFHGVVASAAAPRPRQLALLESPRSPRTGPPSITLRCPRCQSPLEVVGVESSERAA